LLGEARLQHWGECRAREGEDTIAVERRGHAAKLPQSEGQRVDPGQWLSSCPSGADQM